MGTWAGDMRDSVAIRPITGYSSGDPTYGAPVTGIRCRIEGASRRVTSREGDDVEWADVLITETPIDASDTVRGGWMDVGVWLGGASTSDLSKAIRPRSAARISDLDGSDVLYEVTL